MIKNHQDINITNRNQSKTMKYLFLLFFYLIYSSSYAQVATPNILDNTYTPPSNTIFGSQNAINTLNISTSARNFIPNNNNFKLNISNIVRSNIVFLYERSFNSKVSIIMGGGMPFEKDFIYNTFLDMYSNIFNTQVSSSDLTYQEFINGAKYKKGYILSGSFRLFDNNKYYEIGIERVGRTLNYDTATVANNYEKRLILDQKINTAITSYFCNMGWQFNSGDNKFKLSHELSFGIGIKVLSYDSYNANNIVFLGSLQEQVYTKNGLKEKKTMPFIGFNYNIGFGW
ncbi:MAG: hypothetical protein WCK02_09430 [Bacteroidota bacterium]